MNPPPLGRRLAMLTATVSIVASIAVLFVAVPKGIDEYVDEPEITTTIPIVKGSMAEEYAIVTTSTGPTCGIAVVSGQWIVAADAVKGEDAAWVQLPDGDHTAATIFISPDLPELAVVSASTANILTKTSPSFASIKTNEVHQYSVIDCITRQRMDLRLTPAIQESPSSIPVYVDGEIHGIGAVVNENNKVVGVVFEHNHAERLLEGSTFSAFLASVGS